VIVLTGMAAAPASLTMIATVYVALVVFALAVLVSIARFAALLPTYKAQFAEHVDKAISWPTGLAVTRNSSGTWRSSST
jgi:AI-2 transport protein TqsA